MEHRDFEERNVLLSEWGVPSIIDFVFADTDHTCEGQGVCEELVQARCLLFQREVRSIHPLTGSKQLGIPMKRAGLGSRVLRWTHER